MLRGAKFERWLKLAKCGCFGCFTALLIAKGEIYKMPDHVMRVTATELRLVRVTCRQCQLTTELALTKLTRAIGARGECLHCGTDLLNIEKSNPLAELKQAIERLEDAAARMQVDFVIPLEAGR